MHSVLRLIATSIVRRAAWMVPRRWFWLAFLAGAVAMLCSPQEAKASGTPGTLTPTSITGTSRFSTGLSGTLNAVLIETERRSYHAAPVAIPWGTLGSAARAGARGVVRYAPYVGLAMTAADIAGWLKDQDWYTHNDGNPGSERPNTGYTICAPSQFIRLPAQYCVEGSQAAAQRLAAFLMGKPAQSSWPGATVTTATAFLMDTRWNVTMNLKYSNGANALTGVWAEVTNTPPPAGSKNTDYQPATQVLEAEMAEEIGKNPANHYKMLHASNGEPHPFPEVVVALNGMAGSIGAQSGETPVVSVTPQHPSGSSPSDPSPSGSGQGSDLPAFCEWARVVCDFIEWYKDEGEALEEEPMPWDESEIQMQEWSSGLGGGSCPAPVSTSAMGEEVEFSYQPICDFAESMYGVMIAMALAVAAFIIAGLRSGKA